MHKMKNISEKVVDYIYTMLEIQAGEIDGYYDASGNASQFTHEDIVNSYEVT